MSDETKVAANSNEATEAKEESLLGNADSNAEAGDKSILDQAGDEAQATKAAEDKRLLETKDENLSVEDRAKKAEVVKAQADAKAKAAAEAVPEKYEVKIPEGMELDKDALDKITPIFKELGLSNAKAQKLIDAYTQQLKSTQDKMAADFKAVNEGYKKETIEKLGPNYKQELAYAAKCREKFLSSDTVELLNAVGLANAYPVISDLIKIGRLISEDKLVEGKTAVTEKSAAEAMFGSSTK